MSGLCLHAIKRKFKTFTFALLDSSFSLSQLVQERVREYQPNCMIPSSIAVCRPAASGWYSVLIRFPFCDVLMLSCAFHLTVFFTKRQGSCFALRFISRVCSANGFSANPENEPSITGSRFTMAATDSKMKDHSLHPEKVGHLSITPQIHFPCGCHCRLNSCSLGFRCQSLSFSELLAHFRQCLGQLRCHIRSARQSNTIAPLPCFNVWI